MDGGVRRKGTNLGQGLGLAQAPVFVVGGGRTGAAFLGWLHEDGAPPWLRWVKLT